VPGHEGIVSNGKADQLARTGSEHPFIGPEPAWGISIGVAKKAVREWTKRNHKKKKRRKKEKKHCESVTGLREAKGLLQWPFARRMKALLKLNGDQLRWMVELCE
jgi:ribonuclease HI